MAYMGLNQPKPAQPCSVYREHIGLNEVSGGLYNPPSPQQVTDDYRTNSTIDWSPSDYSTTGSAGGIGPALTTLSHTRDTQDYGTGLVAASLIRSDNWLEHVRGKRGVDTDTISNNI